MQAQYGERVLWYKSVSSAIHAPLGVTLQVLRDDVNAMRNMVAELRCMYGSPWFQESNVILLESASCEDVENLFSSSEVS